MDNFKLCVPCLLGLEGPIADELRRMKMQDVQNENGRVYFTGGAKEIAKANINLRIGERVLLELGRFRAETFDELFEKTKALPWEMLIPRDAAFPVKGYSLNSKLFSVSDCQKIIKKAIVERLKSVYGIEWFAETAETYQIQFSIMKDVASLCIDTSGEGLHKRGYRPAHNAAPLKETMAAAMVSLSRYRGREDFCDPFCGSGTLLIEAAFKAMHIAPGLHRHFAAERWDCIPASVWANARAEAIAAIRRDTTFEAYGFDCDPEAIRLSEENIRKAGVKTRIHVMQQDIADFTAVPEQIIICNPPYGERLLDVQAAESLYQIMGGVFPANKQYPCYVISPDANFESFFGKPATKRRKLYNGMIPCQLFSYYGE